MFSPPLPSSISVVVTAKNKRGQPGPITSTDTIFINVDSQGPVINITSPVLGQVIGGPPTTLAFNVSDGANGSGVDESSIVFQYGNVSSAYSSSNTAWRKGGAAGSYLFTFDTKAIDTTGTTVQVTLTVRASDKAGNPSSAEINVYLDDQPPFLSLDPPLVRVTRPSTTGTNCSAPFDPVGSSATSNWDDTYPTDYVRVRALVLEQTNNNGGGALFFARLDTTSVKLYATDSGNPVLVGSTPGSGPCTDIESSVKTAGAVYSLTGVLTSNSSPDYSGTDFASPPAIPSPSICTPGNKASNLLCSGTSDMFYIMPQYYDMTATAIYGIDASSNPSSTLCTGYEWELISAANLKEGWVCLAAEASDLVGNIGVSAPMPVCLDMSGTANCTTANRPTCTDGCTPPSRSYVGDDASGNPIPFVYEYSTF